MKRVIIFLLLIFPLFAVARANNMDFALPDIDIIRESIEIPQQTEQVDIVQEAKEMIFDYYGKRTFEEPSWIRVKKFLTWLDNNKDILNRRINRDKLNLYRENRAAFIGAFLGANYATKEMIGQWFNLVIKLGNTCEAFPNGTMCISVDDFIQGVNSGMHEAAHMIPFVKSKYEKIQEAKESIKASQGVIPYLVSKYGRNLFENEDMYPEEIAVYANLKYGLPIKGGDDVDIREGTRSYFKFANDRFVEKHYKEILKEYCEVVYSATEFSNYPDNNFTNYGPAWLNTVIGVLDKLIKYQVMYDFCGEECYEVEEAYFQYLENVVFKDTVNDIIGTVIDPKLKSLKDKSSDEVFDYLKDLLDENELAMAKIFVKNLKKHADKNIPSIPRGYI